jgi:hypothetical protein
MSAFLHVYSHQLIRLHHLPSLRLSMHLLPNNRSSLLSHLSTFLLPPPSNHVRLLPRVVLAPFCARSNSPRPLHFDVCSYNGPPTRTVEDPPSPSEQPVPFKPTLTALLADATDLPQDPPPPPPPIFSKPGPVFSAPRPATLLSSKPKSRASPRKAGTAAFALLVARPKKQAATSGVEGEDPFNFEGRKSPHKGETPRRSPSKPTSAPTPTESAATTSAVRRSSIRGSRRPSGYFAQRMCLGSSGVLNLPQLTSPQKKAAQGRASEAGISEIDQNAVNFGRENVEPLPKEASLSDPSESPSPIPPPLFAEIHSIPSTASETLAPQPAVTFANIEAAEQWRNNTLPPNITEDDCVRAPLVILLLVLTLR